MKTKNHRSLLFALMLFALCGSADAQQRRKNLPHRFPGSKHCFW